MDNSWKRIFKSWVGVPILILLIVGFLWALTTFVPIFKQSLESRQAKKSLREFYDRYANDKYGGKTPEETYDLLLEALKGNNIELASKYFIVNKQEQWLKTLQQYKTKGYLDNFVKELEENRKKWEKISQIEKDTVSYEYGVVVESSSYAEWNGQKLELPTGIVANFTRFEKNQNGIWKIQLL